MPGFFDFSSTINKERRKRMCDFAISTFNAVASSYLNASHPTISENAVKIANLNDEINDLEEQKKSAEGIERLNIDNQIERKEKVRSTLKKEAKKFTLPLYIPSWDINYANMDIVVKKAALPKSLTSGQFDYVTEVLGRALFAAMIHQPSFNWHKKGVLLLDQKRLLTGFDSEKVKCIYDINFKILAESEEVSENKGLGLGLGLTAREKASLKILQTLLEDTLKQPETQVFITKILKGAIAQYELQVTQEEQDEVEQKEQMNRVG